MLLIAEADVSTPQAQIAVDEFLWQQQEQGERRTSVLRVWEPHCYCVVLGRGSQANQELQRSHVDQDDVPVIRRMTGGAAIVSGPGCIMYSVIISRDDDAALQQITTTHTWILDRLTRRMQAHGIDVRRAGTSDLVQLLGSQRIKCSGNSMRLGRRAVLYHGTLLYNLDLARVARWLKHPPREPDYRQGRTHDAFLGNLNVPFETLRQVIAESFDVDGTEQGPAESDLADLVESRYADNDWTYGR